MDEYFIPLCNRHKVPSRAVFSLLREQLVALEAQQQSVLQEEQHTHLLLVLYRWRERQQQARLFQKETALRSLLYTQELGGLEVIGRRVLKVMAVGEMWILDHGKRLGAKVARAKRERRGEEASDTNTTGDEN